MNYIAVDLEATCWREWVNRENMEIIEIGAVKLDEDFRVVEEFNEFVRPVIVAQLSGFCRKLTSITQQDVDTAEVFADVFPRFLAWIGDGAFVWYSWGAFDRNQFEIELGRHQIEAEDFLDGHKNLKEIFAERNQLEKPIGMMRALKMHDITFEGYHHRGIDDARHLAKLIPLCV